MDNTTFPVLPFTNISARNAGETTSGTTIGAFTSIEVGTNNADNVLGGFIDRPSTTQVRGLVDGWYNFTYEMAGYSSNNDRGCVFTVFKNGLGGTRLDDFNSAISPKNVVTRPQHASSSHVVKLNANDTLEVAMSPLEAGVTVTTVTGYCSISFKLVKIGF